MWQGGMHGGGVHDRGCEWHGGHVWQGVCMAGSCMAGEHGCEVGMHGTQTPLQILQDMVNERVKRILLECILVYKSALL